MIEVTKNKREHLNLQISYNVEKLDFLNEIVKNMMFRLPPF